MALDDRKLEVLRAIVEDYVATQEPVGSKALVERHHLGVSPATVRNDMAVLEEEGYIRQPHTSAGRVPTDARLPAVRRPAVPGQAAQPGRAPGDRALPGRRGRPRRRGAPHGAAARPAHPPGRRRAVSEPGPLVASATWSWCRSPPPGCMLVMIADTGRVEQRLVELPDADRRPTTSPTLRRAGQREARRQQARPTRRRWCRRWSTRRRRSCARPMASRWPRCCWRRWSSGSEERLALAGTANLTRGGLLDFQGSLRPDPRGAGGGGHPAQAHRRGGAEHHPGPDRRRERDRRPARRRRS